MRRESMPISMVDVVVNEGRQQVVGNTDSMKVTSEAGG